jgi:hypothetical protein
MTRALLSLVVVFTLLLSGAARAQESFENLGGTWWFKIGGKDGGALFIAFTTPEFGNFEVDNTITELPSFGFSRTLGSFFEVAAGQALTFDSKGNVVGTLELVDPETEDVVGILTFGKGKPNKKFTSWKITAEIEGDGEPVVAKLSGKRVPETFPVLSGGNPETKLSGKGVKSNAFDFHVLSDLEKGPPAYTFAGAGPVEIDKVETPDTYMLGRFMLTPKFELFGLLEDSSAFGTGDVSGKLKLPSGTLVPKLKLVARADRKVTAKAKLTEATDPVLSVTPTSFDFGALHLDDTDDQAFAVTNVGAGTLSGEANFLEGDSEDFVILDGENEYADLDPNSPAQNVVIRFAPTSAGPKSAQFLFDVGGGRIGAQVVTVTGVGGIAELAVDPNSIDFPDTAVGVAVFENVTITNTGDGVLSGRATVTGADFGVAPLGSNNTVPFIDYELDPGEDTAFSVRFQPASTGDKTGAVNLTGGGGATVPLSGSTP